MNEVHGLGQQKPGQSFGSNEAQATISGHPVKILTHEEPLKGMERVWKGFLNFIATFFSLGLGLLSEGLRKSWRDVWAGKKITVIQMPLSNIPPISDLQRPISLKKPGSVEESFKQDQALNKNKLLPFYLDNFEEIFFPLIRPKEYLGLSSLTAAYNISDFLMRVYEKNKDLFLDGVPQHSSQTETQNNFWELLKEIHTVNQGTSSPTLNPDILRQEPIDHDFYKEVSNLSGYVVLNPDHLRYPPASLMDTVRAGKPLHDASTVSFLHKKTFLKKQHPMRFLPSPFHLTVNALAITEDGKHVLLQQGIRACVPTAVAMLLLDKGITPDYQTILATNLATGDDACRWIEAKGFKAIRPAIREECWLEDAQKCLREKGSMLVGISHPSLANHIIIVDEIDLEKNTVTVRDPFHGQMITIDASEFKLWKPSGEIQIE